MNIGTRQSGRESGGNVVDAYFGQDDIKRAVIAQMYVGRYGPEHYYFDCDAGNKLTQILATYNAKNIQKRLTY